MSPVLLAVLMAETLAAGVVWVGFPIHYAITTRGQWAATAHGRTIMSLTVILGLMIAFTLAQFVLPEVVLLWVALILWPALAVVGLHYHRLLWRDQHPKKPTVVEGA